MGTPRKNWVRRVDRHELGIAAILASGDPRDPMKVWRDGNDQNRVRLLLEIEAIPHVVSPAVASGEVRQIPAPLHEPQGRSEIIYIVRDMSRLGEG